MNFRAALFRLGLLLAFTLTFTHVGAQISFPKGNILDTVIHEEVAYYETQIIFHTGKYRSSDYLYEKISDSLETRWLVTACFNGECRNDLEQNGRFLADYGIDDTTCFIAFHVESHGINGKSRIRYKVINSKDPSDTAILDVRVTYINTTGFKDDPANVMQVNCYPNPATEYVVVALAKASSFEIKITDLQGKILQQQSVINSSEVKIITSQLQAGVYFLQLVNGENISTKKLMVR